SRLRDSVLCSISAYGRMSSSELTINPPMAYINSLSRARCKQALQTRQLALRPAEPHAGSEMIIARGLMLRARYRAFHTISFLCASFDKCSFSLRKSPCFDGCSALSPSRNSQWISRISSSSLTPDRSTASLISDHFINLYLLNYAWTINIVMLQL